MAMRRLHARFARMFNTLWHEVGTNKRQDLRRPTRPLSSRLTRLEPLEMRALLSVAGALDTTQAALYHESSGIASQAPEPVVQPRLL